MITKISKILTLLVVCSLPHQQLFAQHVSRDNFTGNWDDSFTWNPTWSFPQRFISGYNITINGYVTVEGSLSFFNAASVLTVNDTLVINGDLYLNNNNDLIINDEGILIIKGNFWLDEHSLVTANGYFVITGNINKDNDHHAGYFKSNDTPPKVFIGGSVYPSEITHNYFNYPVLNCSDPVTLPYQYSHCSTGNMDDLANDSLFSFFQTTCHITQPTGQIMVCPGDSIRLTAPAGNNYSWNGPANFTSNKQNPLLADADLTMTGVYTVFVTAAHHCEATDTIIVLLNSLPPVSITSSDSILCIDETRTLTGEPAGGIFLVGNGPGLIADNLLKATGDGEISIKYLYNNGCSNSDSQTIVVDSLPDVSITSSDDSLCLNNQRTLTGLPAGGAFTVEGPGLIINDILKATDVGEIFITYSYKHVCGNSTRQTIFSSPEPDADAGISQQLDFHFETRMTGNLDPHEEGTWSLASGTGQIEDSHSPKTKITGLSLGENVFLWTVSNGQCESGSRVTVFVNDIIVPSVFTPNGDGINELFSIGDGSELFEITIFNQWGIVEYQSNSYVNGWDGKNNKDDVLPPETYFYVMKFENGLTKKGTVLIVR